MSFISFDDAGTALTALTTSGNYTVNDLMWPAGRVTMDTAPGLLKKQLGETIEKQLGSDSN